MWLKSQGISQGLRKSDQRDRANKNMHQATFPDIVQN